MIDVLIINKPVMVYTYWCEIDGDVHVDIGPNLIKVGCGMMLLGLSIPVVIIILACISALIFG